MRIKLQMVKESLQFIDGHIHQLADVLSTYTHIRSFRLQSGAMTFRTCGLTSIASHHHTILYLVLILFHHLEKGIDSFKIRCTLPEHPPLFVSKFIIGCEDGKTGLFCPFDDHISPHAHFIATPTDHSTIIHRERTIGDYQMLIDANDFTKALAFWACTQRRIEGEHVFGRFLKRHAIGFKLRTKTIKLGGAVVLIEAE